MLTITVVDLEWFNPKDKPVMYSRAFIELYNSKNYRKLYKIHEIFEFKKMYVSTTGNPDNFSAYWVIKILFVLRNTNMILRNQDRVVFYVNNYND